MNIKIKLLVCFSWLTWSLCAFWGCQSDKKALNQEPSPPKVITKTTVTVQDFLDSPINWKFVKAKLATYSAASKNNRTTYVKEDTYFTVLNDSLVEASIINQAFYLKHGIQIGLQKTDFEALFSVLDNQDAHPYILNLEEDINIGCCTASDPYWSFEFEDGVLVQINYNM